MTQHPIDAGLAQAACEGPAAYYPAVIAATRLVHERLTAKDKLTARIIGHDVARLKDLLRVSVVLNDCTSICFDGEAPFHITMPPPAKFKEMFGTDQLRFNLSRELMESSGLDLENPLLTPAFLYCGSVRQRPLMAAAAPFIADGSLAFQPSRGVLGKKAVANSWHMLGVDPKQPLDQWEPSPVATNASKRPMSIEVESSTANVETLFEVNLPFLSGIPLKHLHGLLRDEPDLVSSFRAAVRTAVRESQKSALTAAEIVADIVNPKVSQIERKLKSLRRVHALKVGGTGVGALVLAYTAAQTTGLAGGVLTFAAGSGAIANQVADYISKRDEVRLEPYFFLWKLRRAKPRKL